MKPLQKFTMVVAVFGMMIATFEAFSIEYKTGKGEEEEEESIQSLYTDLEKAVDTRHFDSAKEALNKMLPLMKRDIKHDKKRLSSWEKIDANVEFDKQVFEKQLTKKNEIYASTKGLVSSSPAAIRVKGKQLVTMLNEYISLVNR